MAFRPLTAHEFRYRTGGVWSAWTACTSGNCTDLGGGQYRINGLDYNIAIGDLQVRVAASGGNPPSAVLTNTVAFTANIPIPIDTILDDDFARSSLGDDYTTEGDADFITDGSSLIVSGGSGSFSDLIKYNAYTSCLEKHTIKLRFLVTTKDSTSYGIGIGVRSINVSDYRSLLGRIDLSTGPTSGKVMLSTTNNSTSDYTQHVISDDAVVFSEGDTLEINIQRVYNIVTITAFNVALPSTIVPATFDFSLGISSPIYVPHNTGQFAIHTFGGEQNVTNFFVGSGALKNINILGIGDSITYGLFSETLEQRFLNVLFNSSEKSNDSNGGGSDKTAEVLARIDEILLINPKYALLMIGGNDIFFGISNEIYESNYINIVSILENSGITVVHCLPTPRNSPNEQPLRDFILSQYSSGKIVDTWTALLGDGTGLNTIYDSGDGTHPNSDGHAKIADQITIDAPEIL